MKRRDVIKSLTLLPVTASVLPLQSLLSTPVEGSRLSSITQDKPMPSLHRDAFVMDGHTHVMTRELLMKTDIGQRYLDGNVDLPRAKEGGVDAMFFSVYTPEHYYPGRFEIKNTFRVVELALDQIKKNNNAIELALNASDIQRITKTGKIAAFLDLEGGYDLYGDLTCCAPCTVSVCAPCSLLRIIPPTHLSMPVMTCIPGVVLTIMEKP
jgi:membrane dipeptidase